MLCRKFIILLTITSSTFLIPFIQVEAANNPNLFVSAENSQFNNRFSGSMVVEVVIRDPNLHDTDQGNGEPDVTINGKSLRMVQSTDGNYYAYFANVDKAKIADSTQSVTSGKGLDFGVFCSRDTASSVFGISLSETDGFAVPRNIGLSGFTNGDASFNQCTGTPTSSTNLNNVVRNAKSINTNPNIPSGQIGLDSDAWPLIQMYAFSTGGNVIIQYNAGGNPQSVVLEYDDSANISLNLDRSLYPKNSEVFLTINDFQLNQDPTDDDSWTFNIDSPIATFYQAYDDSGSDSANGNMGLVNLIPYLSNLGFQDNGKLSIILGNIMELKSNDEQPDVSVDNPDPANPFSQIVTLVENGPNSGVFDNVDDSDESTIVILDDAPRGQIGQIEYNQKSISVLTGSLTSSVSINEPILTVGDGSKSLIPGTKFPVILLDPDQNINSGIKDDLDVFRDTSLIPTLKIGNPITLGNAYDVQFHSSASGLNAGDTSNSSIPDKNSARLFIDTSNVTLSTFEQISLNLGISASDLQSILIDSSISNTDGTNWLNYDLRSFENDFGITDFTDTSIVLSFATLGSLPVTIVDSGDLSSSHGLIQLDDSDIQTISSRSGTVYLVINFDSSNDSSGVGSISAETNNQPIVFDLFSFGLDNNNDINNAIYRFELEETTDNSSKFVGSLEYAVTNQLNILDPNFIKTIRIIDNEIKFIVTNRLIDEKGISISYSDLDKVGVTTTTSTKSNITTNSGIVSTGSTAYRFGQPVTITLKDPDLNLKSDNVDIYLVNNDPTSPNVDTVGKDGDILLEILIKDIRYQRCTVNGVEYGGLASSGFTLIETGPSTGVFEGIFKMPSQICDKSGTKLISSAGGSLDAKYHDSRDISGNQNIFSLLRDKSTTQFSNSPQLSTNKIVIPSSGNSEEIILSGSIANHKRGIPLAITLTHPDGVVQSFAAVISDSGSYRAAFSINENSLSGIYKIQLFHNGDNVGLVSFNAIQNIPDWVKDNARRWSSASISDSEFIDGLKKMINDQIIVSPKERSISERVIPDWVKHNARWWSNDQISDDDFIKSLQYLIKKGIILV
ncbi:MAG: peptidase [Nitrosopumilus sp.]|nr:peptidase [Nitrosopumilus sp.]